MRLSSLGILMISLYTNLQPTKKDPEILTPCDNLEISVYNVTTVPVLTTTPAAVNTTSNDTVSSSSSSPLKDIKV